MENVKYVVLLYKYDVVEVGDLFVILHIYNKSLSYKKKLFISNYYDYEMCCLKRKMRARKRLIDSKTWYL